MSKTTTKKKPSTIRKETTPQTLNDAVHMAAGGFHYMGMSYDEALKRFLRENPQWKKKDVLEIFPEAWQLAIELEEERYDEY